MRRRSTRPGPRSKRRALNLLAGEEDLPHWAIGTGNALHGHPGKPIIHSLDGSTTTSVQLSQVFVFFLEGGIGDTHIDQCPGSSLSNVRFPQNSGPPSQIDREHFGPSEL